MTALSLKIMNQLDDAACTFDQNAKDYKER